jgi:hypothetical protein
MPTPYVTVRAERSASFSTSMSCAGIDRGAGGWAITGGRQFAGGGSACGGPLYAGSGRRGGVAYRDGPASGSESGRCQYASSSGTPVGTLTFTDGTAEGRRRRGRRGHTLYPVDILDEPEPDFDGERTVDFESEEAAPLLPEQTRDDTERGWGESAASNDDRLLEDRPPHWG